MDDLKLIGKLRKSSNSYKQFKCSMMISIQKCVKTVLTKRKSVHSQNLILDINCEIQELEKGKSYQHTVNE